MSNKEYIYVVYRESHVDHIALSAYYDFRSACNEVDELRKQFPYESYGLSKVRIIDSMPF